MFSLKRLFSRKELLDDAETAFVEDRASEAEAAEIRRREGVSPHRLADLESLRVTVSLLRRVQSETAPRSFALAHAPELARYRPPMAAFAPAMAAIIAVVGVALLSIGNLTGVVTQSGDSTTPTQGVLLTNQSESMKGLEDSSTEAPAGAPAPSANGLSTGQAAPAATAAAATPTAAWQGLAPADSGYGMSAEQLATVQANATEQAQTLNPSFGATSDEGRAGVPAATVPASGSSQPEESASPTAARQSRDAVLVTKGSEGIALPVWQLQVSLAGLAALMVAAWAFIRQRSNA